MKEKITAFFFAALFFILYVFIATSFHFYTYFTSFFPKLHLFLIPFAIIFPALYFARPAILKKTIDFIAKYSIFVLPVLVFAVTLAVNRIFVVTEQPDDGIHYVWIAKLLANGRFYLDMPDFPEHYVAPFMFMYHDKYTSIFLPGFSLFLVPFVKLGLEFMLNPLLAGINTFLVGLHAEKLKNRYAALLAMLLFSFSTTHIMHGAYYFPHHFGLMLVLISLYFLIHKPTRSLNVLISGSLIAYTLFLRPQNAVYVYLAFIVYIVAKHRSFRTAAVFTAPFLFFGGLLCCYNWFFTGNPLIFPQDIVFNTLDLKDFCHRPGLGKGCTIVSPVNAPDPETGSTIPFLIRISFLRLNNFVHRITFHQLMLLFIFPVIISKPYKYFLYYFTPLCALAFYFWFFIEGNFAGPRYLMESGALILVLASCGFVEVVEYLFNKNSALSRISAVAMQGVVAGMILFFTFSVLPLFLFKNFGADNPSEIKKLIKNNKIENSILLLPEHSDFHFESILKFHKNPPFDEFGNLVIYSKHKMDENLRKYYAVSGFKSVWKIDYDYLERRFRAEELGFAEDDGSSLVIFGKNVLPSDGQPTLAYMLGNLYNPIAENAFGPYLSENFKFDNTGLFMIFNELGEESFYGFEHSVKSEGTYDFKLTVVPATRCRSNFHLEVNGVKSQSYRHPEAPWDGFSQSLEGSAELKKGKNKFKIVPESPGCMIVSDMLLQKR